MKFAIGDTDDGKNAVISSEDDGSSDIGSPIINQQLPRLPFSVTP